MGIAPFGRSRQIFAILSAEPGQCWALMPGYPSGQREQTVNLPAKPSEVQILLPAQVWQHAYTIRVGEEPLAVPFWSGSSGRETRSVSRTCLGRRPRHAPLAQLAECLHGKEEVSGSNPEGGSAASTLAVTREGLAKVAKRNLMRRHQAAVSSNLKRSLPAGCPCLRQDAVGVANRQRLACASRGGGVAQSVRALDS